MEKCFIYQFCVGLLREVHDAPGLQGGDHHVGKVPADLDPHQVAGGGVPDILRPEQGEGPAVHGDVLGGGQEVEEEEDSSEGGNVGGFNIRL